VSFGTRIILIASFLLGTLTGGCTHRSSELPPSQRSSQITASDILGLELDLQQVNNLPQGDVFAAYLSDYVPDDPSGYQNFKYVNNADLSFLCTTTFAENEDHIFVVIVNNETNASLRLSTENISQLVTLLTDVMVSEIEPDRVNKYPQQSVDLAFRLIRDLNIQGFSDAIETHNWVEILQSIVQKDEDFKILVDILSFSKVPAIFCAGTNIAYLAQGLSGAEFEECDTTGQETQRQVKYENQQRVLDKEFASFLRLNGIIAFGTQSIQAYIQDSILASFDNNDPRLSESITYTEYTYGAEKYYIDNFGNLCILNESGEYINSGINIFNAALNVLISSQDGYNGTNHFYPETWLNMTRLSPDQITRSDLLDAVAANEPDYILFVLTETISGRMENKTFLEIMKYMSEMGPYSTDFMQESLKLYEQLLNSRGAKPTKLTIIGDRIIPKYTGGLSGENNQWT